MSGFLTELKRRHVVRVALVYVAVTFAVLQAADLILPRLGLPEWTVTFVIVLGLLGFPIALVLAWAFEMTPDGVKRTLAATPADTVAPAIRWIGARTVVVIAIALSLAVAAGWFAGRAGSSVQFGSAQAGKSIAVLPFQDMSAGKDQAYFSDGITEEILNALANVPGLRVAARTSAFAFKNVDRDIREIGRTLGVSYVLEGSVRKQGNAVRITAQLIEAGNGLHLWSRNYDGALENVLELQEQIATQIAAALRVPLGIEAAGQLVEHRTDPATYELYLQARAQFNLRGPALADAIQKLREVVRRDSTYVPALATLAEALAVSPVYLDTPWDQAYVEAESMARRTIALDPKSAAARTALANVLRDRWQWAAAEREYLAAIAADSTYPEAYQNYGEFLGYVGRLAEAASIGWRAVQLDPLSAVNHWEYGRRLMALDSPKAAEAELREGIRLAPAHHPPRLSLVLLLAEQGRFDEADTELAALERSGFPKDHTEWIAVALHALRGSTPRAPALARLRRGDNPEAEAAAGTSIARVMLTDMLAGPGPALDLLAAIQTESPRWGLDLPYTLWIPGLDPVRNSPRMRAIVKNMGLNPDGLPKR